MKSLTFRLEESDVDLLKLVASRRGETQADAIRFCIRNGADAIRDERRAAESDGGQAAVSAALEALTAQLAAKDEQIATLGRALEAAQETAKAAQVLHAQEIASLESAEQKAARRWRWPWDRD